MKRRCPNCGKEYETVLEPTEEMVQVAYPNAPAWQREQLLSGICSDKCWAETFNPEEE